MRPGEIARRIAAMKARRPRHQGFHATFRGREGRLVRRAIRRVRDLDDAVRLVEEVLDRGDDRGPDAAVWRDGRIQAVVRRVDETTTEIEYFVCPGCGRVRTDDDDPDEDADGSGEAPCARGGPGCCR